MRRRHFIASLGSAILGWPLAVWAQQAGRVIYLGRSILRSDSTMD